MNITSKELRRIIKEETTAVLKEFERISSEEYPTDPTEFDAFFQKYKDHTLVFFDTETTGLDPSQPEVQVTQFAGMSLTFEDFLSDMHNNGHSIDITIEFTPETDEMWQLEKDVAGEIERGETTSDHEYYSTLPIKKGKIDKSGYVDKREYWDIDKLRDFQKYGENPSTGESVDILEMKEAVRQIQQFLQKSSSLSPSGKMLLLAENASFDVDMMQQFFTRFGIPFPKHETMDTKFIFKTFISPYLNFLLKSKKQGSQRDSEMLSKLTKTGYRGDYISTSLEAVAKAFGTNSDSHHDAMEDVKAMIRTFKESIKYLNQISGSFDQVPDEMRHRYDAKIGSNYQQRLANKAGLGMKGQGDKSAYMPDVPYKDR